MKEIRPQLRERWKGALKRYQYVLLVMAAGVLLMLLGMVGIFVVMVVIMLAVKLLNRFAKDKNDKDGGDAKK